MKLSLAKGKRFVAFAGPSGGGKSTICRMLVDHFANVTVSISNTTRAMRKREREGVDYFFVSKEEFQRQISADEMIEWAEVHGNFYGTSKKFLDKAEADQKIVLLDIDVQGVDSFKRIYSLETVSIFLLPPSLEVLEKRLQGRGTESPEMIAKRLANAKAEIARAKDFDYQVINAELSATFAEICEILIREIGAE